MKQAKKLGMNDIFPFGKYQGEKVSKVLETNPDYILWLDNNNVELDDMVLVYAQEADSELKHGPISLYGNKINRVKFKINLPGSYISGKNLKDENSLEVIYESYALDSI